MLNEIIGKDCLFLWVSFIFLLHQSRNVEAVGQARSSRSILNPNFNDCMIKEENMVSYPLKSKIQCISLCRKETKCLSFSYNKVSQMCVLFNKDFTDVRSTAYEVEAGWLYSYMIKDSELRAASCVGKSLPGICSLYCLGYIKKQRPVLFAELAGICGSYSGGELVKVDRGLKQYCVEQLLETESYGDVFIQGTKNASDNIWKYNDGTEMTFFNWNTAGGQPENTADEIYLGMRKQADYLWHDFYDNSFVYAAVCQQT